MGRCRGASRASGAGGGVLRKVATRAASSRRLPGVKTSGAGAAVARGMAAAGSTQRAASSCRPPSGRSTTRCGSPW